ncbi:sugar ABC transporter permease, partial [Cronobacter sakazakii]
MKTTRWQRRMGHKAVIYIGALMACLFCVFPFYYAIISSLRAG